MKFNGWNLITNFLLSLILIAVLLNFGVLTNSPFILGFLSAFIVGLISTFKSFEEVKKDE